MMDHSNAPESEALGSDDVAIFENARQAVMSLKKTLDMWVVVGRAVVRARDIADRRGGRWMFQRLLDQQGIALALGRDWQSQKAQAHKLIKIVEHLSGVTAWHEKLSPAQQIAWAAPSTVIKHCPIFKTDGDESDEAKSSKSTRAAVLERENAELRAKLAAAAIRDGSLFDLRRDAAKDIGDVIVGAISAGKARDIAKAITAALSKSKPAG
jgi:hypothetical protein